jgi:exodeoxyribonuclease V alpha subunit
MLHGVYADSAAKVQALAKDGRPRGIGLSVGEPVIFTRNDWDRGILNGSLGRVVETRSLPLSMPGTPYPVCVAAFDGERVELTSEDLDWLELAYAVTLHKGQGSQFRRVIIPVRESKYLLDRTLIYTAITRGVEQVVLVGDEEVTRRAIEAEPFAHRRVTGLRAMLDHCPAS